MPDLQDLNKIEIVEGATCTDSTCAQFEAEAHKCEFHTGRPHFATNTITHDDVAVFFACKQAVLEFVAEQIGFAL